MKRITTLAAVAAAALAGCNQPTGPQTAELSAPERPVEELMPEPAPAYAELTDEDVETILATDPPEISFSSSPQTPPETQAYTVRKGDTYWSLARRYLGSGRRWREIAEANPGLLAHSLQIGQTIRIPPE